MFSPRKGLPRLRRPGAVRAVRAAGDRLLLDRLQRRLHRPPDGVLPVRRRARAQRWARRAPRLLRLRPRRVRPGHHRAGRRRAEHRPEPQGRPAADGGVPAAHRRHLPAAGRPVP